MIIEYYQLLIENADHLSWVKTFQDNVSLVCKKQSRVFVDPSTERHKLVGNLKFEVLYFSHDTTKSIKI